MSRQQNQFSVCRRLLRIAILFLAVLSLLLILASISGFFERFFYFSDDIVYSHPDIPYEAVTFASADGPALSGWFFPADDPVGTIVHCHGNAQNMTAHWQLVRFLPARGFNLLVFDYRGYGESEGRPSRSGTVADAKAAVEYVLGRDDVDPERVGIYGQSIGGAIGAVVAASDERVRAAVIDCSFTSYRRMAAHALRLNPATRIAARPLAGLLIASGYDPIDHVGEIAPRPILIVHGTADELVPMEMSRELYQAAGENAELYLIDGAGHLDAHIIIPVEYPNRISRFFADAFAESE